MADVTELQVLRPPTVQKVYSAPTYADIALNADTLAPGDLVKVVTTGNVYLYVSPATVVKLGNDAAGTSGFRGGPFSFLNGGGKAVADSNAAATLTNGLAVFGQGAAEDDSGAVVSYVEDVGPIVTLTTTDQAAHTIAIGLPTGTTELWTPANAGPMHIEVEAAQVSAITARAQFIGFIGAQTNALDPVATGSTTVVTLVQDDVHGLFYDSGFTDADRYFAISNAEDAAANENTTDDNVDTGVDQAAAATYQKFRVTILADGTVEYYIDDTLVSRRPQAAATDVALAPVFYLESNASAIKTCTVKSPVKIWSDA